MPVNWSYIVDKYASMIVLTIISAWIFHSVEYISMFNSFVNEFRFIKINSVIFYLFILYVIEFQREFSSSVFWKKII